MPQLSPMNGFLVMFSTVLMLLLVLINSHYMLKPMTYSRSPSEVLPLTNKVSTNKLYY